MGRKKRSSGRIYDSVSGNGLVVGQHTRKVLGFIVKSKSCQTCSIHKNADDIPQHDCPKTHIGSSESMEVEEMMELLTEIQEEKESSLI